MAAEGDINFMRYIYRGEEGERIPSEATHITVAEDVTVIHEWASSDRRNIVEVICHVNVEKIEKWAFWACTSLRRLVMPGVKIVERRAFSECRALTDVECDKLEIIGEFSFRGTSLRSINLPSARIVEEYAFAGCRSLVDVKFSKKLERFEMRVFGACRSLERITIPLKDDIITNDRIFEGCQNLRHVNLLVEDAELHETIAALHREEWRNDLSEEIESINQILSGAAAGGDEEGAGEMAQVIRRWIRSVHGKIDHYKAEHQCMLDEATTLLELAIWKTNLDDTDESRFVREGVRTTRGSVKRARREICITSGASIVIKNVLPFLQLKS